MRRRAVLSGLAVAGAGSATAAAGCLGPLQPDAVRLARVTLHNAAAVERVVNVTVRHDGTVAYDGTVTLPPDTGERDRLPTRTVRGEWPTDPGRYSVRIDPRGDDRSFGYDLPYDGKLGRCYAVSATFTGGSEVQVSLTSYASGCRE